MTPEAAKRAIATFSTNFALSALSPLGSGTDNSAFLVNNAWVYRFPQHQSAQQGLQKEAALLTNLQSLAIPVPKFEEIAKNGDDLIYVRYRKLPGLPLTRRAFDSLTAEQQATILDSLADFLRNLHAFPVDNAAKCGVQKKLFKGALHVEQMRLLDLAAPLLAKSDLDTIRRAFDKCVQAGYILSLIHADLKPEHILYNPDVPRLSGVLDWGDVCLGDPDYDFACIYLFFGTDFFSRLLTYFPETDTSRLRSKVHFYACFRYIQDIAIDITNGATAQIDHYIDNLKYQLQSLR